MNNPYEHQSSTVLKVGEVTEVNGKVVYVTVDKGKNLSHFFYKGDVLRNLSVGSTIEIRKGFISLIGRVEGEKIRENEEVNDKRDRNQRKLTISLFGYIDEKNVFRGGLKELPLIGNEAFLVTSDRLHIIHRLAKENDLSVSIARTDSEDYTINFPVSGLFNSHIAIFGNTGSGKSNTLAALFSAMYNVLSEKNATKFKENNRFILFDFNGEYSSKECISSDKHVYDLSTKKDDASKIPMPLASLMSLEILSILANATEKTQRPFIKRTLRFYELISKKEESIDYFRVILKNLIIDVLKMSEKVRATLIVDYLRNVLPDKFDSNGLLVDIDSDISWHNKSQEFYINESKIFLRSSSDSIPKTEIFNRVNQYEFKENALDNFIDVLYVQLSNDLVRNRAQNEHIAPAINKLKGSKTDIDKVFDLSGSNDFWNNNFNVINLNNVNITMKKTLPMLIAKNYYEAHKNEGNKKSLSIIIDEAHNILSSNSFRESESWKDYRLETFEEIIKEGRKFGVFVTIASQRPSDISATITSQAHNYFVHRLVNQKDLSAISNSISYIDKVSEESIPTLPTGTCVFSGVAAPLAMKINIHKLEDNVAPNSETVKFETLIS